MSNQTPSTTEFVPLRIAYGKLRDAALAMFPLSAGPEAALRYDGEKVLVPGYSRPRRLRHHQMTKTQSAFFRTMWDTALDNLGEGRRLLAIKLLRNGNLAVESISTDYWRFGDGGEIWLEGRNPIAPASSV